MRGLDPTTANPFSDPNFGKSDPSAAKPVDPQSQRAPAMQRPVSRYVDANGRVLYTNVPRPGSVEARYPVTLYSFACGTVCDTAAALLNKRGVPHTVVDVGSGDGADRLKRLTSGLDAPALQVGDLYTTGFNENRWTRMLNDAGYPKTPPHTAAAAR